MSTALVGFERSDHSAIGADDTKGRQKIPENIQVHHGQGGASPSWTMLQDVTTQACHFIGNPKATVWNYGGAEYLDNDLLHDKYMATRHSNI